MAPNTLRKCSGWIVLLVCLLLCGCTGLLRDKNALHRLDEVAALPKDARIGVTAFSSCGGSYLDRLSPEYHQQDSKANFYRTCTSLGHPQTFSRQLRQRLEERLGRKLVLVKVDKPFKPKLVLNQAEKLGLEYVIAGDLLYLGSREGRSMASATLYLIRVADAKIVVVGRVKKESSGSITSVIDDLADQLFATAFE